MTYAIAAAGTGGHVYPGLAVAEALLAAGVGRDEIAFFGGGRMEAQAVPAAGFAFFELELRGLSRSLSPSNLAIPVLVWRASRAARAEMERREVRALLGMGGYVTIPVAYAARRMGARVILHEQNAHAGLANRVAARWADRVFVSFTTTSGLTGEAVGNPLRARFTNFDAPALRGEAFRYYDLDPDVPTVGVFGGSLGARALNQAVTTLATDWSDGRVQIVHLVGSIHENDVHIGADGSTVNRCIVAFEERMELFYAASDVVLTRAGGSLFEVAATGTPSIVVPGMFGGGHQAENAAAMAEVGAAIVLPEPELATLTAVVGDLLHDSDRRSRMTEAAKRVARPDAAKMVAAAMMELANV